MVLGDDGAVDPTFFRRRLMSFSIVPLARRSVFVAFASLAAGCVLATSSLAQTPPAPAPSTPPASMTPAATGRVFELRTYHCHPGRLDALNKRFRDHTNRIFKKHGMEMVGYWTPIDQPDTLIYILAFPSRDAATQAWAAFRADPEWNAARTASEADGPIVQKVDSVFMSPTDYSPVK
jgi:hypothetical protein